MSFERVHNGEAGRVTKVYKNAGGTHFGHSPLDQPDDYAYITDSRGRKELINLKKRIAA